MTGGLLGGRSLPGGRGALGRVPGGAGWTDARDLPAPPTDTFRAWWTRTHGGRDEGPQPGPSGRGEAR